MSERGRKTRSPMLLCRSTTCSILHYAHRTLASLTLPSLLPYLTLPYPTLPNITLPHPNLFLLSIALHTSFFDIYEKNVMSAKMLEVSLVGVGTVPRLERDAWSTVELLRQATHERLPPPTVLHFTLPYLFLPPSIPYSILP